MFFYVESRPEERRSNSRLLYRTCSRSSTAKCAVIRFGSWCFTSDEYDIGCAFSMTSAGPSLPFSPGQCPPLNAMQNIPPRVLFPSVGLCLYTRSLCRAVSSQGLGVSGRSAVKEAVSERGGARQRCIKRRGSFYLSLPCDMASVRVEGLVCEAPPQPLPWLVSRYYL